MKLALIGGSDIKKYSIADIVWKKISEISGIKFDFEMVPIEDFADLCKFYWNFVEDNDFVGFNIALPWKMEILKLFDRKILKQTKYSAINTVYKNDILHITNTDIIGLEKSLLNSINIKGKDVLILGGGGAGMPSAQYLSCKYDCTVYLYDIKNTKPQPGKIVVLNKYYEIIARKYDIIINATPIGKYYFNQQPSNFSLPLGLEELDLIIKKDTVVQEMNYFPYITQLLKYAKSHDLTIISGVSMLIYQALESFKLYTGRELNNEETSRLFNEIIEISIKNEHELF